MSILAFLDLKFQKICSKCQIFNEIIKQTRLIDHYYHFKMTDSFYFTRKMLIKYDLSLKIWQKYQLIREKYYVLDHKVILK